MTWGSSWGSLWGGGGTGPGQDDHVEQGLARIYEQFKTSPNILALLEVINAEANALEAAVFDVKLYTAISTANGQTLDDIGDMLDLARLGLDDEAYRCALGVRIRSLFSSGTANDGLEVLNGLLKDDVRLRGIAEFPPASFCLFATDLTADELSLFAQILPDIPAAGVSACLVTWNVGEVFAYGDATELGLAAFGYSDATDPTIEAAGFADALEL